MVGSPSVLEVLVRTPKLETQFAVRRNSTARQLFVQVCDILDLEEQWFFGLKFVDQKGSTVWLKSEELLTSCAAHGKHSPLHFIFCVRFWPQEAAWTLSDVATELLFLQVRSAVLDGKLICQASTAIELAAYALQARCGDFTDARLERGQLMGNRHLPQKLEGQLRGASEQWQQRVAAVHQRLRGLPRRDAMHEYLRRAQQLPDYGATFFNIRCEHPLGGQSAGRRVRWFWLGVTPSGVNVSEDKLTPLLRIPWDQVRTTRYQGCKCSLKLRDRDKFRFFTRSLEQSEELLATIKGENRAITQQRKNSDGDDLSALDASCPSEGEGEVLTEGGADSSCSQCGGSDTEVEDEEHQDSESPAWMESLAATGWLELVQQWRRRERTAGGGSTSRPVSEASPPPPLRTAPSADSGLASWAGSIADVVTPADAELTSADARRKRYSSASRDSGVLRLSVTSDEVFV